MPQDNTIYLERYNLLSIELNKPQTEKELNRITFIMQWCIDMHEKHREKFCIGKYIKMPHEKRAV